MSGSIFSQKPPGYKPKTRTKTLGPTKLARLLQKIIAGATEIDVIPKIYRTRAGRHQKSRGVWSWRMETEDGAIIVGSQQTATEISRSKTITTFEPHPFCRDMVELLGE